jgi:Domain of unknown function (DUF4926)
MTFKDYDVVALTESTQAIHEETPQPILLSRGQVGIIVMSFNGEAYLIDFADNEGQTYAMETLPAQNSCCFCLHLRWSQASNVGAITSTASTF